MKEYRYIESTFDELRMFAKVKASIKDLSPLDIYLNWVAKGGWELVSCFVYNDKWHFVWRGEDTSRSPRISLI